MQEKLEKSSAITKVLNYIAVISSQNVIRTNTLFSTKIIQGDKADTFLSSNTDALKHLQIIIAH